MLIAIASTIYLALALALCIAVLLFVYWAATKLVVMLSDHDDSPPPRPSRPTQRRRSR